MKPIIITAPDLNISLSGISIYVRELISLSDINYIHFNVGKKDFKKRNVFWVVQQLLVPVHFLYFNYVHRKCSIIHVNTAIMTLALPRDLMLTILAKSVNKKVIIHIHGGNEKILNNTIYRIIFKLMLKLSNIVIALNNAEWFKYCKDISKIIIIPNFINCNKVVKYSCIKKLNQILFIGRIDANKGLEEIYLALKGLGEFKDRFIFVICGNGPKKDEFIYKINSLGIRFQYLGVVSGDKKWRVIARSKYFILPSYYEGLPISLLEAMSVGCVPIVTPVGGIPNAVKHGVNGIIVGLKNYLQLKDGLLELLNDDIKYNSMSTSARNTIQKEYNHNKIITEIKNLYLGINGV